MNGDDQRRTQRLGLVNNQSQTPPDQVPDRIAHFRILSVLGSGGMGVVYRAEDEILHRTVALKVLRGSLVDDLARRRFFREARVGAAISHPNVAVVHQIGDADGHIYIAMELVEGESLRKRISAGPLAVEDARALAVQIARGLGAAHARGLIHRDLKPENVVVTPDGVAKLLDFGIAKAASDHQGPGSPGAPDATGEQRTVVGSPAYMSPEQAHGEPLDARSDIFSFGILLYEMLAGTRPFLGTSSMSVLLAITNDVPPLLRTLAPDVDEATEAIVTRCLAKNPAERFQSARHLVEALGGAPSLRRRTRRALIGAAVAAVALFAAGAVRLFHRPPGSASSRSTIPAAQRLFDEATRAFQDDTGGERELLERATKLDPEFGGAYLRLLALTILTPAASQDAVNRYRAQTLKLDSTLSPQDHALLDCLASDDWSRQSAGLDTYLSQNSHDDLAWVLRTRDDTAGDALHRALAARPRLPRLLAAQADALKFADKQDEALKVLDACLARTPHAIHCVRARAKLLAATGACERSTQAARFWLDLEPDAPEAHNLLAGLVANAGAPVASVREVLGDPSQAKEDLTHSPHAHMTYSPEVSLLMFQGEFAEAARVAERVASEVPPSAQDSEHFAPLADLTVAWTEQGDLARAGQVAMDYLSRRAAWKDPCAQCEAGMLGTAVHGGQLKPEEAIERVLADYHTIMDAGASPQTAWVSTFGYFAQSPEEARLSLVWLDRLGVKPPFTKSIAFAGLAFFLAGAGETSRPMLEVRTTRCTEMFSNTFTWARVHEALGELDDQRGDKTAACGHYAKVIQVWRDAKPPSVTAVEAQRRARALACNP